MILKFQLAKINKKINMHKNMDSLNIDEKSNIRKNKNHKNKIINYFNPRRNYLMIIFFLIFNNLISEFLQAIINDYSSNITIKINKSGMQKIYFTGDSCYHNRKFELPNKVFINNREIEEVVLNEYSLEEEQNTIKLQWNERKENWGCLFKDCINIVEIDFSQFDYSQNIYGNNMFSNCASVTLFNMNDFGIVKLKDAGSIFRDIYGFFNIIKFIKF